jgi:hypothetical protein
VWNCPYIRVDSMPSPVYKEKAEIIHAWFLANFSNIYPQGLHLKKSLYVSSCPVHKQLETLQQLLRMQPTSSQNSSSSSLSLVLGDQPGQGGSGGGIGEAAQVGALDEELKRLQAEESRLVIHTRH